MKSYARALALWWQFLAAYGLEWDAVTIEDFGRFLGWLRSGDLPAVPSIERRPARFSEGTVELRVQAVCSFYRYHHFNGVEAASRLYERVFSRGRSYKPMLEHLARRRGTERRVVRVSRPRPAQPPTLTPDQVGARVEDQPDAGVPVHVVQRYLGHLSPRMTMHYAKTLQETHEREFLRYRRINADARDLELDHRGLFALIELDKRTDRVLPNGLCMLPPRQVCNRGNACLTCDKFATDASYLDEHEMQPVKLTKLIGPRQELFRAKTGSEMSPSNVWLEQRLTEQRALEKIITVLQQPQLASDAATAIRGAATSARRANQQPGETDASDAAW